MRRFHATTVAVENQIVLHILSVCVFVALGIQHAMCMRHIVICGLPRSTIFFSLLLIKGTIFEGGRGGLTEQKMCVLIFYNVCLNYFSF